MNRYCDHEISLPFFHSVWYSKSEVNHYDHKTDKSSDRRCQNSRRYQRHRGCSRISLGDGQHGTARWATEQEIRSNYALVPFRVADWRAGRNLPEAQGLVLGSRDSRKGGITALVDSDDIHCLMIGASGVGKTAYFLYPNLEYACACGMSFFATDTKGDLARNYGAVAKKYYGYHVSVVDLRNPTRSDGYNLMTLINRYMDKALREHSIEAYGKAENLINILAHSIISPKGEESRGQNDYFYKAAEGVVASVLLLLAEFLPPDKDHPTEREIWLRPLWNHQISQRLPPCPQRWRR